MELESLPLDDPATYELLARGDTLGVFQLDGGPMRELLRRMQPDGFEDIVAVLALYRPGPMGMNAHNDYADRKNGRRPIKPIHPELAEPLAEILAETYGLIVYQEQVMASRRRSPGYSLGQADLLRRAMGKKKREVLDKEFEGFCDGHDGQRLLRRRAIKTLWDTSFRSPTTRSTSRTPPATGWCRTGRPTSRPTTRPSTWPALLTSRRRRQGQGRASTWPTAAGWASRCCRPTSTSPAANFAPVGTDIRFGLGAIRNVGANVVEFADRHPHRARASSPTSPTSCARSTSRPATRRSSSRWSRPAPSTRSATRARACSWCTADAVDSVLGTKKAEAIGQFDLFGGADERRRRYRRFVRSPSACPTRSGTTSTQLAFEREMLGLYVSGHPLNGVAHLLATQVDTQIPAILGGDVANDTQVRVGGILACVNRRVNKNGMPWASAQLEDLTGGIEVMFFPQTYSMFGAEIADDAVVLVGAKVRVQDDRISLDRQ